jgi:hypothetical protein
MLKHVYRSVTLRSCTDSQATGSTELTGWNLEIGQISLRSAECTLHTVLVTFAIVQLRARKPNTLTMEEQTI